MSFNPFILQFHWLEMSDSEYSSDEDDSGESQNNEQTYRVSDLPTVLSNKTATPQVRQEQTGNRRSETGTAQKSGSCPPPSPWKSSRSKQWIIEALKDKLLDIHLFIGKYSVSDFSSVNFGGIMQQYSCGGYKRSNFRQNVKRLLVRYLAKTGPFKARGIVIKYSTRLSARSLQEYFNKSMTMSWCLNPATLKRCCFDLPCPTNCSEFNSRLRACPLCRRAAQAKPMHHKI